VTASRTDRGMRIEGRFGDSLHALARDNEASLLSAAAHRYPEHLDAYETHRELQVVIFRHGLKATPLHVAALHGSVDAVNVLLRLGADPSKNIMQCERGVDFVPDSTALHLARKRGFENVVSVLESHDARECMTPGKDVR